MQTLDIRAIYFIRTTKRESSKGGERRGGALQQRREKSLEKYKLLLRGDIGETWEQKKKIV